MTVLLMGLGDALSGVSFLFVVLHQVNRRMRRGVITVMYAEVDIWSLAYRKLKQS